MDNLDSVVLDNVKSEGNRSISQIAKSLNMEVVAVRPVLTRLKKSGALTMTGSKRGSKYTFNSSFQATAPAETVVASA